MLISAVIRFLASTTSHRISCTLRMRVAKSGVEWAASSMRRRMECSRALLLRASRAILMAVMSTPRQVVPTTSPRTFRSATAFQRMRRRAPRRVRISVSAESGTSTPPGSRIRAMARRWSSGTMV